MNASFVFDFQQLAENFSSHSSRSKIRVLPTFSIVRLAGWIVAMVGCGLATDAQAGAPKVQFDTVPLIACREVTTPEFATAFPQEKLIEARFHVSALIQHGDEGDLLQILYRVDSPRASLRVFDFLPKTTLASDVAGNVTIEQKTEKVSHLGVTITPPIACTVKAGGSGEVGSKTNDSIRYELVPPMEAVAASGTLRRGQAVYFKLRPSRTTSLEGGKEFIVVFQVPRNWRGDFVQFDCRAAGVIRGVVSPLDEPTSAGGSRFVIGLFIAGDTAAQAAAERLAAAETNLLRLAASQHEEIEKRSYPTFAHKLGAIFDAVEPKVPKIWPQRLIYAREDYEPNDIAEYLPPTVRDAAFDYVAAKRELCTLR